MEKIPGQAEMTQLMIMLNLFEGVKRPAEIARNMDLTLQGVQYHLRILKERSLVDHNNTISQNGFEYLYSGLNNIRGFVSENIFKLDRVITWEAISQDNISKGEAVYLKMKDGYLSAYASRVSESMGVSVTDGKKGGIIGVTRVEGIIDVDIKEITILILPDVEDIAGKTENLEKISSKLHEISADLHSVIGEEAAYVAKSLKLRSIIEYAPLEASFEAARRGMSSVVLVSNRRFRFLLEDLKLLENKNEEVKVRLLNI